MVKACFKDLTSHHTSSIQSYLLSAIFITEGSVTVVIIRGNIISYPDCTSFLHLRREVRECPSVVHGIGTFNVPKMVRTR